MTDWWTALYDDLLADLFLDGADPAEAGRTADDLVTLLGLSPGDRVFDQGCGTGRLSKPLLARGMRVVGGGPRPPLHRPVPGGVRGLRGPRPL